MEAAEAGDAKAQYELATCYVSGDGVTRSLKEALKWLQKSADQGYAEAQERVAMNYEKGVGGPQDLKKLFSGIVNRPNKDLLTHMYIPEDIRSLCCW